MLRLNKIECRPVVGHYDEDGNLVDEEIGRHIQPIFTETQFADYLKALRAELGQRNAED